MQYRIKKKTFVFREKINRYIILNPSNRTETFWYLKAREFFELLRISLIDTMY